jgi:ABC-type bacteriocin/lantibiotic exporter with double-glycine peptidase domain
LILSARAVGLALLIGLTTARAQTPRAVPPSAIWIDVPYVQQPREGCGAASLAMVMAYWAGKQGRALGPEGDVATIQHELYSPRDHGITADNLAGYLRRNGYQVFALNAGWNDLEEQLRKGRPLIVALRPSGQKELHYVVVDGIDSSRGLITINDPAERKLLTRERAGFEKEWSATHNWMLLALPKTSPK